MIGPQRQSAIYVAGVSGDRPPVPVTVEGLEDAATAAMTADARAYVLGGAGSGHTMRANRAAFDAHRIVPRVFRDVEARNQSCTLLGLTLPSPLLTAPIGVLEIVHPEADLAVARAAAAEGVPMIFSNQASVPMEACAAVMGDTPRFFQLYWSRSDDLVQSFLQRAEQCGCRGVVLTLDTTMLGWRPHDLDRASLPFLRGMGIAQYTSDPVFRRELALPLPGPPGPSARPSLAAIGVLRDLLRRAPGPWGEKLRTQWPRAAVQRFVSTYSRPTLTWADIPRLRAMTRLPIILKGIVHPDDARRAADEGVDAIVVSNHGGRQVDRSIATLDALPGVVRAVDGRLPVLLDSGIRSGADIFIALALGARAVLVGRPYVFGLTLAGSVGVRAVLQHLRAELDLTMGLSGCRTLADIGRDCLASPSAAS